MTRSFFLLTMMVLITALSAPVAAQDSAPPPVVSSSTPVVTQVQNAPVTQIMPRQEQEGALASFFNRLFDKLFGRTREPDPTATLVAPFAAENTQSPVVTPSYLTNPVAPKAESLDRPHRSSDDLATWLQRAIAETLSFNAQNYEPHLNVLARGFNLAGLEEYNAWIIGSGTLESLRQNGMQLNGFVTDKPLLLNEGVVDGRYRWLYEIPVMISFVPRGATTYKGNAGVDSRRLIITLQLGRVAESVLPEQVMIETWRTAQNTRRK